MTSKEVNHTQQTLGYFYFEYIVVRLTDRALDYNLLHSRSILLLLLYVPLEDLTRRNHYTYLVIS